MTSVPHSGAKSVTPGGSVAGHTPGPWEAKRYPDGDCWHIHFGDKGGWLGEVYIDGDENGAAADARLIAAAPDLLAVAQIVRMSFGWQTLSEETKALLDDAIAKATAGETRNAEPIHRRDGDAESGGVNHNALEGQA